MPVILLGYYDMNSEDQIYPDNGVSGTIAGRTDPGALEPDPQNSEGFKAQGFSYRKFFIFFRTSIDFSIVVQLLGCDSPLKKKYFR